MVHPGPDRFVARLNRQDEAGFVAEVGTLYEHSPWIAALAFPYRPFADREALHATMQRIVREASRVLQLDLIRAHPDLAGRLARAGGLGAHSTVEQGGLGLDRLDDGEYEQFERLNLAYRARFDFPFVIAVRGHTRASVIAAFETRLRHDPETEVATALDEIGRIAGYRLVDLS